MKKITTILITLLLSIFGSPVSAETRHKNEGLSQREEIKIWKKSKAAMHPLQLKTLVEEKNKLQKLVQELQADKEALEEELDKLKVKMSAREVAQQNQGPKSTEWIHAGENVYWPQGMVGSDGLGKDDWAMDKNGRFYVKGIVYKVQIGAYKKRDLSHVLENKKSQEFFEQERREGVNMYTLGHFRNYSKANQFKKELRAMGLKDAWVVAFKDGKRVPLKEVLQEIIKNK